MGGIWGGIGGVVAYGLQASFILRNLYEDTWVAYTFSSWDHRPLPTRPESHIYFTYLAL